MDIEGILGILALVTPPVAAIIIKIKHPELYKNLGGSFWMITIGGIMLLIATFRGGQWLIGEVDGTNESQRQKLKEMKNPYELINDGYTSNPELFYNKVTSSKYNPDGYSFYIMDNDEYGNKKYILWITLVISKNDYDEINKFKNITYLGNSKYFRVFQDEWGKCIGKELYYNREIKEKKEVCNIDGYKVFITQKK